MKILTFSPKTNVSEFIIGIKPACFKKRYIIVDKTGYKKKMGEFAILLRDRVGCSFFMGERVTCKKNG